jgi:hypothetical protein
MIVTTDTNGIHLIIKTEDNCDTSSIAWFNTIHGNNWRFIDNPFTD